MLITELAEFARQISERFHAVNCGGCCVMASLMYSALKPHVEDIEIYFMDKNSGDVDDAVSEVQRFARENEDYNLSRFETCYKIACHHAVITFTYDGIRYMWDSDDGPKPFDEYRGSQRLRFYPVPFEIANGMAQQEYGWNRMFSRSQIPDMEMAVHHFSKELSSC